MIRTKYMAALALGALVIAFGAPQAEALRCSQWTRMGPGKRQQAIERMIESGLASSNARRYQLNEARLRNCLYGKLHEMELDFDGACAGNADLQVLNRIFKNYAWSCVG